MKTPNKCPFQGTNLKVTKAEEGRGKEKVGTCAVAVPSEVVFFLFFFGGGPGCNDNLPHTILTGTEEEYNFKLF